MAPPTALNAHAVADTEATAVPSRLTINEVPSQRAKAGKLNGGVAAATSSDLFKFPVSSSRENSLLLCGCVMFLRQFDGSSFCVHNHWFWCYFSIRELLRLAVDRRTLVDVS